MNNTNKIYNNTFPITNKYWYYNYHINIFNCKIFIKMTYTTVLYKPRRNNESKCSQELRKSTGLYRLLHKVQIVLFQVYELTVLAQWMRKKDISFFKMCFF